MKYCLSTLIACATLTLPLSGTTIEDAVMQAIETNPKTCGRFMNYLSSKEGIKIAKSEFYPHINAEYNIGPERADNSSTRATFGGASRFTNRNGSLYLTQKLFDWGKTYWTWLQKREESYASCGELRDTMERVAYDAAKAYLNVYRTKKVLEILKENEEVHKNMVDKINKKVEGGAGRKSEIQLAISRYASAQARVSRAEADVESATNTFIEIVGTTPPDAPIIPPNFHMFKESLEELTNVAICNNPMIAAKYAEASSQYARTKSVKRNLFPTIDADFTLFQGDDLNGIPGRNVLANGLLSFNWELYSGGRKLAEIRSEKALYGEILMELEETKRSVINDVSTSYEVYSIGQQRYKELKHYRENIHEFYESQEKEFTLDLISLFDLLNSQTEYYNAFIEETNGQIEVYLDAYQLMKSIGGLVNYVYCPLSEGY